MLLKKETFEKWGYNIDDLRMGSNKLVIYICDYCNQLSEKQYYKYNKGRQTIEKDCCKNKPCNQTKISQVFEMKYGKGIRSALQVPAFFEKQQKTTQDRFGVTNIFSDPNTKEKIKQTNIEKYGVGNPQQNKEIKEKTKQTLKLKTGFEYPLQNPESLKKTEDKIEERFGVRHFGELQKIDFSEIIELCKNKSYELLLSEELYRNNKQLLPLKCVFHGETFSASVGAMRNNDHQCPRCQDVYSSKQEQEIFDFIVGLGIPENEIIRRDRKILGVEMDIFLPKINFAIEHHGLYYHSDKFKDFELHYKKFFLAKEKGIFLFQIYGDEWQEKQDMCKSMIKTHLGLIKNKINARDCYVLQVDKNSNKHLRRKVINFMEDNHVQGNSNGTISYFILCDKKTNEIYSSVTLRNLMNNKRDKVSDVKPIEIARFCCKQNSSVRGCFSKQLKVVKSWCKDKGYSEIFTYSDCRYSWGNVYEKNGFEYRGHTGIGHYYLLENKRYQRLPTRLRRGNNKSEEQILKDEDIFKIYNAGHYRWELKI